MSTHQWSADDFCEELGHVAKLMETRPGPMVGNAAFQTLSQTYEKVVLAKREAGQTSVNFGIGREGWSLVSLLTLVSYNAKHGVATWAPTNSMACVSANEIAHALTFAKTKNGFRTLLPYHLK